jgi:hypothetical protein
MLYVLCMMFCAMYSAMNTSLDYVLHTSTLTIIQARHWKRYYCQTLLNEHCHNGWICHLVSVILNSCYYVIMLICYQGIYVYFPLFVCKCGISHVKVSNCKLHVRHNTMSEHEIIWTRRVITSAFNVVQSGHVHIKATTDEVYIYSY